MKFNFIKSFKYLLILSINSIKKQMDQYLILLSFLLFFLINKILIKKKILLNFNGEKHQKITGQTDIPLSGGILFIILLLYSFFDVGNFLISIVF